MRSFITCTTLLSNIISVLKARSIKRTGHVGRMGDTGNIYKFLVGKPDGKTSVGSPRC
jgi:hypothetical protein